MRAKEPDIHEDTSRFAKTDKKGDKESMDGNYDIQKHFFLSSVQLMGTCMTIRWKDTKECKGRMA